MGALFAVSADQDEEGNTVISYKRLMQRKSGPR